ncbi:MAG: hypothetical protein FIA93_07345, partial [Deltaproteobacteria bacterium]|nr:hypothetical protein [Deltaproteobacteria bacterium]
MRSLPVKKRFAGSFLLYPSYPRTVLSAFAAVVLFLSLQGVALAGSTSKYPVLLNSFPGVSDPGDVAPPNASGAAGLAHLVAMTSAGMAVFDKGTGNLLSQTPLQEFWAPLGTGPGEPAAQPAFGPRVVYDQYIERFVAVSVAGKQAPDSWLLIAVSETSDPTGPWYRWAINASQNNDLPTFPPHVSPPPTLWADYPCLGFAKARINITVNMYSNDNVYQYPKEYEIPADQLISGRNPITWYERRDPIRSFPLYLNYVYPPRFAWQPTQLNGEIDDAYFIAEVGGFQTSTVSSGGLRIARSEYRSDLGYSNDFDLGYIYIDYYSSAALPPAAQAGNGLPIDTNDQRLQSVVFRDGYLWVAHTVADNTNNRTEIAWYQIDPNLADPADADATWGYLHHPVQQGRISDPIRSYFNPSIAVNANHDVVIGFSGSSPQEYPGAFYAARAGGDPPGTMRPIETLKPGEAPYTRLVGGTRKAWGIYSATVVDPIDNVTFWTLQEYSAAPDNTWGTWWGAVSAGPPAVSGVSVTATPPGPTTPGTAVTFTASASGGSGSYEYEFLGRAAGSSVWSVAQPYGPGPSWTWTGVAGSWEVMVNARNVGSTAPYEATATIPYAIQSQSPGLG